MILSLIAAASENNVVGKDGDLPWHLPAEMKYYRDTTLGKPIIMGRKTHEGIGRALPKRHNIVVTRQEGYEAAEGCDVVATVEEGIELAKKDGIEEAFIIGGGEIYKLAMPYIDKLYITRVHTVVENGTAFLPDIDMSNWREIKKEEHAADADNPIAYTIYVYEKK